MANYMKSEFYRILHGRTIYLLTLALTSLLVLMNVVLFLFMTYAPGFYYGTVRFSFIWPISDMQVFFIGGFLVVMLLSSDEYKNGVMKNAVAGGMNRIHIFIGKCIVYGIVAMISAAVILAVYILTTYALLEADFSVPLESTLPLKVLLTGAAANLPFSLASIVLTVALNQIFQKEIQVSIGWASVTYLIPLAVRLLGMQLPLCARIARWLPWNFLSTEVSVAFGSMQMDALWMHPEGFLKEMIVGAVGILLFGAVGICGIRKKDIS